MSVSMMISLFEKYGSANIAFSYYAPVHQSDEFTSPLKNPPTILSTMFVATPHHQVVKDDLTVSIKLRREDGYTETAYLSELRRLWFTGDIRVFWISCDAEERLEFHEISAYTFAEEWKSEVLSKAFA